MALKFKINFEGRRSSGASGSLYIERDGAFFLDVEGAVENSDSWTSRSDTHKHFRAEIRPH
jgi:hypothetical protein